MNNSPLTFQEDALSLIKSKIDKINQKYQNIDTETFNNLNINEAEDLIDLIKKLDFECNNILEILNNIQNLKINTLKNKLIEKELNMKITPIMMVYRTLLLEKYRDFNYRFINDLE